MRKVVILGRGGAGKSTLAARLGDRTGLPVIELDKHFWPADLTPLPATRWTTIQNELTAAPAWIMDGDLGPYDVLAPRLSAADTVIILNFPLWRCTYRALRRSREPRAFWHWVLTYRRKHLPPILAALAEHAPTAEIHILRTPTEVEKFLTGRAP